jgi:16S rRNA (uracil1498-N3)-methyltransferase
MRRFRIPESWDGESGISLTGRDARYLSRVLRLRPGDSFPGMDAKGERFELRIVSISREGIRLEAGKEGKQAPAAAVGGESALEKNILIRPGITLYQCLPKGRKMDLILRQAAEAGVSRVVPLESRYSEVKSEAYRDANRLERWERVIREALQQSGSLVPTRVEKIRPFKEIDEFRLTAPERIGIFFHQEPLETRSLHEYLTGDPLEIGLVIGPEGGLSEEEIDFLIAAGYVPAYLGHSVLRTETAALYALASAQMILLEKSSWTLRPKTGSLE